MNGRCPPEDYDRILRILRFWNLLAWVLGLIGLLVVTGTLLLSGLKSIPVYRVTEASIALELGFGSIVYVAGVVAYARRKGLHAAWGLMGFACLPGLLALLFVARRCRYCRRSCAGFSMDCKGCGGPI